jgi:hypothetical protein
VTALILHIGTEKTGTTSIQEFLALNRSLLAAQGIHVPEFLGATNQRWGPYMAENLDRVDGFSQELGLGESAEKRLAKKEEIRAQLVEEVSLHPEATWLISSEHFQSRLTTPQEVARLAAILQPLFAEIRIVIYLRHPLETAISYWGMRVRGGAPLATLGEPGSFGHHICDHRGILERWLAEFAPSSFCVRLFERQSFVAGDLIRDFCTAAGIHWHPGLQMPPRLNETLSYQAIRLLARINEHVPRWIDGRINPNRAVLGASFLDCFASFPPYQPSCSERERYRSFYHDSEEWVRAAFFPQRSRLWAEVEARDDDDPRFASALDPLETALVDLVVRLCQER